MDAGVLTTTLQHFLQVFSHGWSNLQPAINFLIKVFLGIEIVMFGLWMALGGLENLAAIMKKLLFLMIWLWFVKNFPMLANAFVKSLVHAGELASGGGGGDIFDPSLVMKIGFQNLAPAFEEINKVSSILDLPKALLLGIGLFLVAIAYILIAWQIFYAVLEFYLISALVGLFLPFGFVEQTKFLAEKAIGAVVSAGIKLMVLAFIVGVIEPVLMTLTFSGDITYAEVLSALLTVGALAFLCWNAPGVAAGLMAGSPSLSAGVALQNMAVAGGAAALAAYGMTQAGSKIAESVKSAGKMPDGSGSTPSGGAGSASAAAASPAAAQSGVAGSSGSSSGMAAGSGTQSGNTPSGSQSGGGDKSGDWAKEALKAMHKTPEEAQPSGGGAQARL
jgi:type IV secretion system protein TrbL